MDPECFINLRPRRFRPGCSSSDGADEHPHVSACQQVPAEVLEWRNRSALLLEEILEADADVIALQEVNHYGVRCRCAPDVPP